MNEWTDGRLVAQYLDGDHQAFNDLVRRWEKRIYNFVLRYCGNREDAQDLSQEVFTSAFQRLSSLRDTERFSSWLYSIALNACRMRARATGRRRTLSLDSPEELPTVELQMQKSASQLPPNPEQVSSQKEMEELVRLTLREISEEQRVVILLKEYEGLKFQEIADMLSCPLSTVKSRLYLGLIAMRRQLESHDFVMSSRR